MQQVAQALGLAVRLLEVRERRLIVVAGGWVLLLHSNSLLRSPKRSLVVLEPAGRGVRRLLLDHAEWVLRSSVIQTLFR